MTKRSLLHLIQAVWISMESVPELLKWGWMSLTSRSPSPKAGAHVISKACQKLEGIVLVTGPESRSVQLRECMPKP
eukprot:g8074.t1